MTTPQRSYNMSRIKGRDTKPEMIVRRYLWAHGFRYRLNHKRLPGRPDIVLRKYRTCIFVNGCFWHGHKASLPAFQQSSNSPQVPSFPEGQKPRRESAANAEIDYDGIQNSECCKIPHTNREFWVNKIMRNKERDIEVQKELAKMGWHCITVWECSLSPALPRREGEKSQREQTLERLAYTLNEIYLKDHSVHHQKKYSMPEDESYAMAAEDLHNEYEQGT